VSAGFFALCEPAEIFLFSFSEKENRRESGVPSILRSKISPQGQFI
jgi:hypothetical protein